MIDPLAEVVTLLQPSAPLSKLVSAAGPWRVRRLEPGQPFYCVILEGSLRLQVEGREALLLEAGDFVLIPSVLDFTASSLVPPEGDGDSPYAISPEGEVRHGDASAPAEVRMAVGYCVFASTDASLFVPLLPELVLVRGDPRLSTLVELVRDEFRAQRSARELVLTRLLEVLLIEALRSTASTDASPGLLRGLADERVAIAIRKMHERPADPWTIALLAKEAALSRSAFFDRFQRAVGVAPMAYLLGWRMALAKDLLRKGRPGVTVAEVAERVGYSSASTFSVAFTRHVGLPPTHYARSLAPEQLQDVGQL